MHLQGTSPLQPLVWGLLMLPLQQPGALSGIPSRMAAPMRKQREASLGVHALLTSAGVKV